MSNPEPVKSPVAEGEIIAGKYKVERILGVGGMGVVVAAMHIHLRQRVAIKFLLPDSGAELITRFMREARASAKLKSEHIARVIDVAELPDSMGRAPYMVMEYLDGSDLSRVLRKRGALPVDDAVDYLLQACEAIAEAHSVGIVHRDLKPANLFLTKAADGSATVKVLDFGISKDTSEQVGEEEMALTRTTAVLGSPYYMAPEQMRSTRTVDARADIWSIGIILYQLVTKIVPFKAGSFVELALMVVNDDPQPPTVHRPDLPPELEAAILRCIRKNPAERFSSVAELAAAIAPFGRAGAVGSAERIARTQGAPLPMIERPSGVSIVPPPPSAVSGRDSGSGSGSLGSALSSGPSIPSVTPGSGNQSGSQSTTGSRQAARSATQQSPAPTPAASTPPPAPAATGSHTGGAQAPVTGAAPGTYPAAPFGAPGYPAAPVGAPSVAPPGPLTSTGLPSSPSIPPPASITGSSTGPAHAATASTWAGAPVAAQQARRSGARGVLIAGFLLGVVAVAGTVVVLRARTSAVATGHASTSAPTEGTAPSPSAAPTQLITQESPTQPANPQRDPSGPTGPGPIQVTAGPAAPALGAPVSTTTTMPGGRPGAKGSNAPSAMPVPAAVPAAPTATPAVAPPPPPTAAPTAAPHKKSVLDMEIQ